MSVLYGEEADALKRKYFPGLDEDLYGIIRICEYKGGWYGEIDDRLRSRGEMWRKSWYGIRSGRKGYQYNKDYLYKTPEGAVKALADELKHLHGCVGEMLGLPNA